MTRYPKSDRELRGLRGAVRVCVEQSVFPDGAPAPRHNPPSSIEFTREGMLVGSISDVPFTRDEAGRKIRVRVSRPEDYRNRSAGGSPFSLADRRPNLPDGGTATTYYDEYDRPVEAEVSNSKNELVARAVRSYDQKGRIAEENLTMFSPAAYFPPDLLPSISANEQVKGRLNRRIRSIKYFYDSGDQPVRTLYYDPDQEVEVITSYNEHGDLAFERATARAKVDDGDAGTADPSSYSEIRYSYQYDQAGNWTQKAVLGRSSAESSFVLTLTWRRTLEYF